MLYAHYNDTYKKLLHLALVMGADPKHLFRSQGFDVSNSQLQAWRVGRGHKSFRPIPEESLLAFVDGLIAYAENRQ